MAEAKFAAWIGSLSLRVTCHLRRMRCVCKLLRYLFCPWAQVAFVCFRMSTHTTQINIYGNKTPGFCVRHHLWLWRCAQDIRQEQFWIFERSFPRVSYWSLLTCEPFCCWDCGGLTLNARDGIHHNLVVVVLGDQQHTAGMTVSVSQEAVCFQSLRGFLEPEPRWQNPAIFTFQLCLACRALPHSGDFAACAWPYCDQVFWLWHSWAVYQL